MKTKANIAGIPQQDELRLDESPAWRKMMRFYAQLKPGIWLMKLPLIGKALQKLWIPEGTDANWFITINEAIPVALQYALPLEILTCLLKEADGIFAMKACPCRIAFDCREHPHDLGCLHLGPATRAIPPEIGRVISTEEALYYASSALENGLTPTILHMESEAELFRVDATRMLSVCFCCECCCDVRLLLREGPDRYWDQYNQRLPGLRVTVGETCTSCGECISACYGGERVITIQGGQAQIGERCIGCGRCVVACPENAIRVEFDPEVDVINSLMKRIRGRAEIFTTP